MSRYTYVGEFKNPAKAFVVRTGAQVLRDAQELVRWRDHLELHVDFDNPLGLREGIEINRDHYYVCVEEDAMCNCGCPNCHKKMATVFRLHTSHATGKWESFEDSEYAYETIQGIEEFFEEDYDSYLEENRYEIAQMERYEAFRNEY